LATWLTEIYLDRLNELRTAETSQGEAKMPRRTSSLGLAASARDDDVDSAETYFGVREEFHSFLETHKDSLKKHTTMELIASEGLACVCSRLRPSSRSSRRPRAG
jgi:hypothetical protein